MKKVMISACSIIMLGLMLVSCSLPASTSSNTFATNTPNVPFPVATNAQLVHEVVSGTQTAQAMQTQSPNQGLPTIPQGSTGLPTFPSLYTSTPGGVFIGTVTKTLMPFATSTPGKPATYTIHAGEYCYCLARRFNINPDTLVSANPSCNNTTLDPGTIITIPQTAGAWPGERARFPHPTSYVVRGGDTIYLIACYFGDVDPNIIIAANGLQLPYTLTVGQSLQIP